MVQKDLMVNSKESLQFNYGKNCGKENENNIASEAGFRKRNFRVFVCLGFWGFGVFEGLGGFLAVKSLVGKC